LCILKYGNTTIGFVIFTIVLGITRVYMAQNLLFFCKKLHLVYDKNKSTYFIITIYLKSYKI